MASPLDPHSLTSEHLTASLRPSVTFTDGYDPHAERPREFIRFGAYELLEVLGTGGMGTVYLARDTNLDRTVALKMMHGGKDAPAPVVERFLREARAVAQLHHRHIVPIYEYGTHEGQPFFTMEYVRGGSLAKHMDHIRRDLRVAVALMEKIARAVHDAHSRKILHRDLKPGNILLNDDDEPLVADFGLAKFLDASTELTKSGNPIGTAAYMSPEQATGKLSAIGPASDIWSLGVMLYELLTRRRPFPGSSSEELTLQIVRQDPQPPRAISPGLDPALDHVVLKCLQKSPGHRYATAKDLADDLARWLAGEPTTGRYDPSRTPATRHRRQRRAFLIGGTALVLGTGTGGLSWWFAKSAAADHRAAALASITERFLSGQETELVGKSGPPAWLDRLTGKIRNPRDPSEPFSCIANPTCLIDLLPEPSCLTYRYSAEVRFDSGTGYAGIFVGRSKQPAAGQDYHCCCMLGLGPLRAGQQSVDVDYLYIPADPTRAHMSPSHPLELDPGTNGGWHTLEIRASPEKFEARVDGQIVFNQLRPELLRRAAERRSFVPALSGVKPNFSPEEALGLAGYESTFSVRNLILQKEKRSE